MRNAARHETASTRRPADEWAEQRRGRRRCRPDADRAPALLAAERVGQDRERTRHEQRTRRALQHAEHDEELHRRREAAQGRREAEPDAGRSRTSGVGRSSRSGRLRGSAARSATAGRRCRRTTGPRGRRRSTPAGRARSPAGRPSPPSRRGTPSTSRAWRRPASSASPNSCALNPDMPGGPSALDSGAHAWRRRGASAIRSWVATSEGLGGELLRAIGPRRPRVVVVAVDVEAGAPRTAVSRRGSSAARIEAVEQFRRLGADVEAVVVRSEADADDVRFAQAIGEAGLVWLTGERARDILDRAARHARLVGRPAGARAGRDRRRLRERRRVALSARTLEVGPRARASRSIGGQALGLVEGVSIVPDYEATSRGNPGSRGAHGASRHRRRRARRRNGPRRPRRRVAGPRQSAVSRSGAARRRERHRAGDVIRLRIPDDGRPSRNEPSAEDGSIGRQRVGSAGTGPTCPR